MLNKTHLEHSVIAVVIQLLGCLIVSPEWAGSVAVAVFVGREISQHETKGGGANNVHPLYGVLNHWNTDSVLDILCPLLACSVVAGIFQLV